MSVFFRCVRSLLFVMLTGGLIFIPGLWAQTYVPHPLGITASTQDLAADKDGNLHIIWVKSGELFYGRIVNNRVTSQVKVSSIANGETFFCRPRLAVRNDGKTVHVVWGVDTLTHAWRDSGGTWHKETVRGQVNNRRYYGAVCAVTQDEAVHVLYQYWSSLTHAAPMIYLRKSNGGSWSSDMSVGSDPNTEYRDPSVFIDSYGGFHASWRGFIKPSAAYRYAPAGTNLERATTLYIPLAADVKHNAFGDLFVGDNGRVHRAIATWTNRDTVTIDYSFRNIGGNFTAPTRPSVGDLGTESDSNAAIAADSSGHVLVSYYDFVAGKTVVYLSILNDGTWTKYVVDPNIGIKYNQHIKPSLAATPNGIYGLWRSLSGEIILGAALISPPSASLTVNSPNSNETWGSGSSHNITWTSDNVSGTVDIFLYRHFSRVGVIARDVPVSNGTYAWPVGDYHGGTAPNGQGYKIRIQTSNGNCDDESNCAFTISGSVVPSLSVTSPNGGENLPSGSSQSITWSERNIDGTVSIYLNRNDSRLGTIATGVAASSGIYSWGVGSYQGGTAPDGSGYKVNIEAADGQTQDSSDGAFSIVVQQDPLSVTSPSSGVTWPIGSTQRITWSSSGVSGNLNIYLIKGTRQIGTIATAVPVSNGSYDWKAGFKKNGTRVGAGSNYRIRIVSASNARVKALSNGFFSLAVPRIVVKTPGKEVKWPINSDKQITWTYVLISGDVEIFLYRFGGNKGQIAMVPVDDLSYSWTIGRLANGTMVPPGSGYQIRIKSSDGITGQSRGTFTITK